MYISVERIMLENFAVDLLAIWASLRPTTRLHAGRLAMAAAAGAIFSGCICIAELPNAISSLCALAFAPVIVLIAAGPGSLYSLLGASASLVCVSAFIAALVSLTPLNLIPAAALASLLAALCLGRRRRWIETWDIDICITHSGVSARFQAMIDTGNRLTEPLSGLPVLVVEESLVKAMLPGGFDPAKASDTLPHGFRILAFGGLGGEGALACFMPECMHAVYEGTVRSISNVWVAVYPGALPGRLRALAPASLIRTW